MEPRNLNIFEKRKGIYISPENIIAVCLTTLVLIIAYLKESLHFVFNGWENILWIFWCLYIVGLLISTFFRYEREIGHYKGKLIFWEDRLQLNENNYNLSEIAKLNFIHAYDIKGMFLNHLVEFKPRLSNGLKNELILTFKNGKTIKCNFLQTESERLKYFKEVLTHYHREGIIDWFQLLNLLDIQDYHKIQEFKNEMAKVDNTSS